MERSVKARNILEDWHDKQVKKLKIDLSKNRIPKSGIEGFFAQIPALIDDKWKYERLKRGMAEKITSQAQTNPQAMIEQKAIYEDEVQIIIKDGKYYYLPYSKNDDAE